jgi:hypothetical protein
MSDIEFDIVTLSDQGEPMRYIVYDGRLTVV